MKKMVLLAAFVAAGAAFVACSSNDDLVQAPTSPEETIDEGIPLTIKVIDATRGDYASASTLDKFTVFSTQNGGTTRWLGERDTESPLVSAGVEFNNTYVDPEDHSKGYNGTFTSGERKWLDGTWDFYAISDATFPTEFIDPADETKGEQDAEHLDAASDRNFTYVVPTNYNNQKDLLVAASMGKKSTDNGGVITFPFQHALAQIGQITFTFTGDNAQYDNTSYFFIIKGVTLCNILSKGKYTFPATWTENAEQRNLNNEGTWDAIEGTESEYYFDLAPFDTDDNGNIEIFVETPDDETEPNPAEFTATAFATGTKRGSTDVPNYFQCPSANGTFEYALPLAKNNKEDDGLFVLPQDLTPTVWDEDANGIIGVSSGAYARIEGVILNFSDSADPESIDEAPLGWAAAQNVMTLPNNYYVTRQLSENLVSYLVPLEVSAGKTKKVLKAGYRYNLTFNLAEAVSLANGQHVFASEEVDP